jgi:SAM-dependent methyltransferase
VARKIPSRMAANPFPKASVVSNLISRGQWFGWIAALTILLSAFLLFQVQPLESKSLLPWFGGNPSVWNTCVLFFQLTLLAGYCYAHNMASRPATQQAWIHGILLVVALATLTVIPGSAWKPTGGESASTRILLILLVHIGLPFFILSTTGPLVQMWFSRFYPGRSPYRLYALSNVGSLAALALYPFVFEPIFDLPTQAMMWKGGFVLFGLLIGTLAISMAMTFGNAPMVIEEPPTTDEPPPKGVEPSPKKSFGIGTFLAWVALPWIASVASLAVTGHLTEDVPTVPFMLIVPFMLYLLSFIICFDAERWYVRWFFCGGCILMALGLGIAEQASSWDKMFSDANVSVRPSRWLDTAVNEVVEAAFYVPENVLTKRAFDGTSEPSAWGQQLARIKPHRFRVESIDYDPVYQSMFYLTFLFFACMTCHGEVAALKPAPEYSTLYFLAIATGGALGGMFVALYCPTMSQSKIELPISMTCSVIAAVVGLCFGIVPRLKSSEFWRVALIVMGFAVLGSIVAAAIALKLKSGDPWFVASIGLGIVWGVTLAVLLTLHSNPGIYKGIGISSVAICGLMVAVLWVLNINRRDPEEIDRVRGFFGVLEVEQLKAGDTVLGKSLVHGRIQHGYQHVKTDEPDYSQRPTTYYAANSGIGLAIRFHPNAGQMRVAVVGLGTGTTAAYAGEGETYHFYEIDPKMLALSDKHFTYRRDAQARGADVEVKLGDARLTMERIEPQNYDVIAVDAFSGDSIPVHLLTEECMRDAYLKHLKPDGILAIHISNRYLDLEPVVRNLAVKNGMSVRKVDFVPPGEDWEPPLELPELAENDVQLTAAPHYLDEGESYWVLVTKNPDFLKKRFILISATDEKVVCAPEDKNEFAPAPKIVPWTDRHSPLWQILVVGG